VETPQKVEVITREDIEKTISTDLTEVLKKTAGVDVIQYPGVLSGIGIRGFRPEFSGINKRSLLLIDGRPAGTENLATVLLDNVERIEVLKGPASALYGSSAMGGVVNIITRKSRGPIGGRLEAGFGSFETYDLGAQVGGNITETTDFDLGASYFNQADDFRMGGAGNVRPNTSYRTHNLYGRLGSNFLESWRVDGKFDVY
jgi:outer membrane cobalamin receptor